MIHPQILKNKNLSLEITESEKFLKLLKKLLLTNDEVETIVPSTKSIEEKTE